MKPLDLEAFIVEHVARVEPLTRAHGLAYWESATTGQPEAAEREAQLRAEWLALHAEPESFQRLRTWYESAAPPDPWLARQLKLLYLTFAAHQQDAATIRELAQVEKEVRHLYTNFRGEFNGRAVSDNEIAAILAEERDSHRLQAAWEASKQIGPQVAAQILTLVHLRNQSARRLGFDNHYRKTLALNEIDETRLFQILSDLEQQTNEPFRRTKAALDAQLAERFGVAPRELRPWHYADPFFQRPPQTDGLDLDLLFAGRDIEALAVRTYTGLDLDVRDILARSDLYARPGKNQHAFCLFIDHREDIRILCNLEPNLRWMETLLHELGHAAYDKYLGPDLPFLLRNPAHTISTEAVALLLERFPLEAAWLSTVVGIPAPEADALAPQLSARRQLAMLVQLRWMLVMIHFERALYAEPEQDLNTLWWDLVERYQYVPRPERRNAPDWAAKIHIALFPVYYQNYLLGQLMASQLHHHLTQRAGSLVDQLEVGQYLCRAIFEPGASLDWETLVEQATGERLTSDYFIQEFVSESHVSGKSLAEF